MSLSNISTAVLALTVAAFFLGRTRERQSEKSIPIAGFQIGSLNFTNLYYHLIKRVDFYHQYYHQTLGPIFRASSLEGVDEIYIACPDAAKKVLTSPDFTLDPPMAQISEGLLPNSLICLPTGPDWKMHRQAMQPGFAPMHIRQSASISFNLTRELVDKVWAPQGDEVVVNVWETMNLLMLDIMGKVMFSADFKAIYLEDGARDGVFGNTEKEFLDPFITRTLLPGFLWPLFGVGVKSKRIVDTRKRYEDFMRGVVGKVAESQESSSEQEPLEFSQTLDMNFMSRLLLATKQGKLTESDMFSELIIMFLAGQDTTTSLITSMVTFLAKNPTLQTRLWEEIRTLSSEIDSTDLDKLEFLDAVCKETLRLDSAVPATLRQAATDTELGGYHVKKGSKVYVSLNSVNRDAQSYKNPDAFDPDRWIGENASNSRNPNAFIPFGGGGRMCIGRKMSMAEAKAVLVALLMDYQFEWIRGDDEPVEIVSLVTTFPKNLKIKFVKRNDIPRRDSVIA